MSYARTGELARGNARLLDDQRRIEYAKAAIEEMAREAIRAGRNGTIGVELSIKDGRLGKVKRLQIDFQKE
jgi:uncharacterized protein YbjQ (UPF0145 family)